MEKSVPFFCGKIPHLSVRLQETADFTSMFMEEDKYYAAIVFEEKLKLRILKLTDPFLMECLVDSHVYTATDPLYNLVVDENPEFYIISAEKLSTIVDFCEQLGFEYDDQSGSSL